MADFALKDGVLFAGGAFTAARIQSLDLEAIADGWSARSHPIPWPDRVKHDSINRVGIDEDRLRCVDTAIGQFDKRWLVYDISNPRGPTLTRVVPMHPEEQRRPDGLRT